MLPFLPDRRGPVFARRLHLHIRVLRGVEVDRCDRPPRPSHGFLVLARDGRPAAGAHNEGHRLLGRVGGDCGGGAIIQLLVGDVIPNASIDGGRATGFTAHPNDLGALTAIAFVPALMLASRPRIAAHYACLLISPAAPCRGWADSVGVHRRADRGAATVVWLAFQRTSIHGLLAIAALAMCAVALVSLQSIRGAPHPLERLESATTSSSSPEAERSSDQSTSGSGHTESQ